MTIDDSIKVLEAFSRAAEPRAPTLERVVQAMKRIEAARKVAR